MCVLIIAFVEVSNFIPSVLDMYDYFDYFYRSLKIH